MKVERLAIVKLGTRPVRLLAASVITAAAVALPVTALASSGHSTSGHSTSGPAPACTSSNTRIWFGLGEGGGTLSTEFFPLEFSNVGRRACSLFGYPGVSLVSPISGRQIGPAGSHSGRRRTVVLQPGGTAHVVLAYLQAGFECSGSHLKKGTVLRIFAPGEKSAELIPTITFEACTNHGLLHVDAIHPSAGIPGFNRS
jgi:hypothetical protein